MDFRPISGRFWLKFRGFGLETMRSAARRSTALRAFDGHRPLPFTEMPGPKWPLLGALPTFMSYGVTQMHEPFGHGFHANSPRFAAICHCDP